MGCHRRAMMAEIGPRRAPRRPRLTFSKVRTATNIAVTDDWRPTIVWDNSKNSCRLPKEATRTIGRVNDRARPKALAGHVTPARLGCSFSIYLSPAAADV